MAKFIIVNEHSPDECEPMEAGMPKIPDAWRGLPFYCTCPSGRHGYFLITDGDSVESVSQDLPTEFKAGTTEIYGLEVMNL